MYMSSRSSSKTHVPIGTGSKPLRMVATAGLQALSASASEGAADMAATAAMNEKSSVFFIVYLQKNHHRQTSQALRSVSTRQSPRGLYRPHASPRGAPRKEAN